MITESAEIVTLRDATGMSHELHQDRVKQEISMMPLSLLGIPSQEQLADLDSLP